MCCSAGTADENINLLMACEDRDVIVFSWDDDARICSSLRIVTVNGITTETDGIATAEHCCAAGTTSSGSALSMACINTDVTVLSWDEDTGICSSLRTVTFNGITTETDGEATFEECCTAGMTTNDFALLMACEDNIVTVLEWDES